MADPAPVPKDISEHYATGNTVVATYQTSGVAGYGNGKPQLTAGQADSLTVVAAPGRMDEAGMNRLMDHLSDVGSAATTGGSTGALLSVSQSGQGAFDVVTGARGDSQMFLVKLDAQNNVTITDFNSRLKEAANPMGVMEFGPFGERGGNMMASAHIEVKPGEKAFIFGASDGLMDPYIAQGSKNGQGAYVQDMARDLQSYLKANPQAQDISRFLAERATQMGSADNTSVVSMRLDAQTDLRGQSVTMAVFDGTGHEDGTLSSALARGVEQEIPGAVKPAVAARTELAHVATRAEDLARVANPATPDPHAAPVKAAPAKAAPPETPPPKAPPHEEPHPGGQGGGGRRVQGHAGTAAGIAQVGVDVAAGRYGDALESAATQAALNPNTYKAAAALTEGAGTAGRLLGFAGKKIPIVGAVVTAGYVLYEVGGDVYDGKYGKASAALAAGAAETVGNIAGFGVGDLARETVREGVVQTAGEEYAPNKSGLRQLGEEAYAVGSKFFSGGDDKPAAPQAAQNRPPRPAGPKPG